MHPAANEIVAEAKKLVGVPFKHQGRDLRGIDCVGVAIYIAKVLGIKEWDTLAYPPRPNMALFEKLIRDTGSTKISYTELANGDMVRLMSGSRFPVHLGIYEKDAGGREYVIHAYMPYKTVVRSPLTDKLRAEIHEVWRFPE